MQIDRPSLAGGRPERRLGGLRRSIAIVVGLLALIAQTMATPVHAAQTWTVNLYTWRAFLYQDPYSTACTAATTMQMLNMIAYAHAGGDSFIWTPYRVKNNTTNPYDARDMVSVLWFERGHDTLAASGIGSDPHGWRNAVNFYGWGPTTLTDPTLAVYDDLEYPTYDAAVHAAVRAIAQFGMPVGIVSWAGRHAQVMTGYVVDGEDPATSDLFTVLDVYLSDPLLADATVNQMIPSATFKSGSVRLRFQAYRETDSPFDDHYQAGWIRSSVAPTVGPSEWYNKWVIVAPIRAKPGDPIPTPSPTPSPTPTPAPTPTPTSTATPKPSAPPSSSPAPSAAPSASPAPSSAP